MNTRTTLTILLLAGAALPGPGDPAATAGPVWCESIDGNSDAGSTANTAQHTTGSGKNECIEGSTCTAGPVCEDFEDMYLIHICEPQKFTALTVPEACGSASFDTQLWLFRPLPGEPFTIFGFLANNDGPPPLGTTGSRIIPIPDDGSPALDDPGLYYLAISGLGDVPRSDGGVIFLPDLPTEVTGPDGPGGDFPHTGWMTMASAETGMYRIAMTGVAFANVPTTDCNGNFTPDTCDIYSGFSDDVNGNGVPDECEGCTADITGPDGGPDGNVDALDYLQLIAQWGSPCGGPCTADLTGPGGAPDGIVNALDFLLLISQWGSPCP